MSNAVFRVDGPPPATFGELAERLRRSLPGLTRQRQRIARMVLFDPESCAFTTVRELAAVCQVNESTIVRLANELGLDGFPGMKALCADHLKSRAQLVHRFRGLEQLVVMGENLREQTHLFDQDNLTRTFSAIDDPAWLTATSALAHSPKVHVVGLRKCYSVGYLLAYLLEMCRDGVNSIVPGPGTIAELVRRVEPGDALVAISIHRYTRDTVRVAKFAHQQGAYVIALTDNPGSPLASHADSSFYVETAGPGVFRSLTAFVSLAEALAAEVASIRGAATRASLLREERLLDAFDVYVEPLLDSSCERARRATAPTTADTSE